MSDPDVICTRKYGDTECPLHAGSDVVSLCEKCCKLVCLDCMTSEEHKGHPFCKLEDILHETNNDVNAALEDISKTCIPETSKSLIEIDEKERFLQAQETLLLEKVDKRFELVIKELTKARELLEDKVKCVHGKQKEELKASKETFSISKQNFENDLIKYKHAVSMGTKVEKFDASQLIQKRREEAKSLPNIPENEPLELVFDKSATSLLINNLLGEIKCPFDLYPSHSYIISSLSSFNNESTLFTGFTPNTVDTVWCTMRKIDEEAKTHICTNELFLINNQGVINKKYKLGASLSWLGLHPISGVLYGTFEDHTIRTIDPLTGKDTFVLKCHNEPFILAITPKSDVIVGDYEFGYISRYSLEGQLLYKSKTKNNIWDISYNVVNGNIAVAYGDQGFQVMDGTLTNVIHTNTLKCPTIVYDKYGSLVVGELIKKAIHILDGNTFAVIRTFSIPNISYIRKIRLYQNSMWVLCRYPRKIVQAKFK